MTTLIEKRLIKLNINGKETEVEVDPKRTLLDVLREDFDLTGAKKACDHGECGSCIVLLGKKGVMACLLPVSRAENKIVTTVESLASHQKNTDDLDPLQRAFIDCGASQCGYCIPGIIMQSKALLIANPNPTREDVVKYLARNVCRCTGYVKIIDAVLQAASVMRGEEKVLAPSGNGNGHIVGHSMDRLDTINEVTGDAKYAADLKKPGMLYAKVLRSPHHHANILKMDVSKAAALPGVEAVITSKDVPGKILMLNGRPQMYVFPTNKTRHMGEGLAAVAASSEEIAEEAINLIEIEYEPLDSVLYPLEALDESKPRILDSVPNVDPEVAEVTFGDPKTGFDQADVIVEDVYTCPNWEHMTMETEAALSYWEDDRMTIHVPLHHSFKGQEFISEMLDLPKSKVRIICPPMGGGFGARGDFYAASMAALLTYKTNKPVKIVYSREESLMSSCKAPQYYMKYKTGATKEGKLVAMEAEFLLSGGSWAPYMNPDMMMFGRLPMSPVHHSTGPYHIPNVHVTAREVATNHPRATPLRGTVGSPVAFACESQMDKLAIKLNMDPIEFRLKNVLEIGSETHYGQIMEESVGARECFEALKPHFEEAKKWASLNPVDDDWKRGVGFAAGWRSIIKSGMNLLLSAAEILETGKVRISVGAVEKGQGSMTALAQIAAQELGLAWGQIEMLMGDTYLAPYPVETNSSKVTIMVGAAVQNAANALKVSIKEAAAEMLETDTSNILIKDGYIFNEQFPDESLTLNALASYMKEKDKQVKTEGSFIWPPDEKKDPTKNLYVMGDRPNIVYAFTGQVSQVEVNTKTGKVRVPKAAHCSDPGTVINPRALEGQIEGGMTFGMGFAISEEWIPGKSLSYKDYKVTTIRDVYEEIDVLFAGGGTLSCGPFGAKGAGEMSDVAPVPSIINGIVSACGVRVLDLPASPDRVKGLLEKETPNSS